MARLRAAYTRIRSFYDPAREPLRRSVYTALLAIVGAAVTFGIITGTTAATLGGPLALVLAVPAVERARSLVTPVAATAINDTPGQHSVDRLTP